MAAEAAILAAFQDLLREVGFARLRLEHVAEKAGVSKATIYRRWRSKEEVAAHVLRQLAEARIPAGAAVAAGPTAAGSVLTAPETGPVIRALLCEIANNPVVGEAYRTHVLARQRAAIRAGLAGPEGTAASDAEVERAVDQLLGELYYRFVFDAAPERDGAVAAPAGPLGARP